jgi:hypothetical protein
VEALRTTRSISHHFRFSGAITSDLPIIGNGNIQTCLSHPDHRVSLQPNCKNRARMKYTPRWPPGGGYAYAHARGRIPRSLQIRGKEHSKSFTGVEEHGLIPCITTGLSIQDSYSGANIIGYKLSLSRFLSHGAHKDTWTKSQLFANLEDSTRGLEMGLSARLRSHQTCATPSSTRQSTKERAGMLVDVEEDDKGLSDSVVHVDVPPPGPPALPHESIGPWLPRGARPRTCLSLPGQSCSHARYIRKL